VSLPTMMALSTAVRQPNYGDCLLFAGWFAFDILPSVPDKSLKTGSGQQLMRPPS